MLTYALSAAFAMRGGLGEDAALRSITLTPARILGVADRIGSLEPGKDADLLIADAPNGSTQDNMFSAMENGDVPGIGVVIIDGVIRVFRSRNSPPPAKVPQILKQPTAQLPSF